MAMTHPESNRPVLVTGATGFVGEHLLRCLVQDHQAVIGLGNQKSVTVPGAGRMQVDLRRADLVAALMRRLQPDLVFHCAAQTNVLRCQQNPAAARQSIVGVTQHLVHAVSDAVPAATLVAISTDLVFNGEHPPYREEDRPDPLSVYGCLKLEAEASVLTLAHGAVLRSSLVYGPATTHKGGVLAWMMGTLMRNEPLTLFEDEVRTPIHVADLCTAMIAVGDRGRSGLWHAGGGQRLDRVAMGQALCDALGFGHELIRPARRADSEYPVPRPRDVSLDSTRLWSWLGHHPLGFAGAVGLIAQAHRRSRLRQADANNTDSEGEDSVS